jgi:hypothetical protein
MRELFIYYRIPVAQAQAAHAAVLAFQARLRQRHPGLTTRFLRRPDAQDQHQTWMEIYSFDSAISPSGITASLQGEIEFEASALAGLTAGGRHVEVFVPCAS